MDVVYLHVLTLESRAKKEIEKVGRELIATAECYVALTEINRGFRMLEKLDFFFGGSKPNV